MLDVTVPSQPRSVGSRLPVTVVVVAPDPLLRAGLTAALMGEADLQVLAEAAAPPLGTRARPAPLLVLGLEPGGSAGTLEALRRRGEPQPLVVVAPVPRTDELDVLRGSPSGFAYLTRGTTCPDDLRRAVHAVASGATRVDEPVVALLLADRRPDRRGPHPGPLSARQAQVLAELAEGWSNSEIARRLHLSRRTVEKHVGSLYLALGLTGDTRRDPRVSAALLASRVVDPAVASPARRVLPPA